MKYSIKSKWNEYYKFLEALRQSGTTNMFGAVPYLRMTYKKLSEKEAQEILLSWISNYNELNKKFGWRN